MMSTDADDDLFFNHFWIPRDHLHYSRIFVIIEFGILAHQICIFQRPWTLVWIIICCLWYPSFYGYLDHSIDHFRYRWADNDWLLMSEFIMDLWMKSLKLTLRTVWDRNNILDRFSLMEILKSARNSIICLKLTSLVTKRTLTTDYR